MERFITPNRALEIEEQNPHEMKKMFPNLDKIDRNMQQLRDVKQMILAGKTDAEILAAFPTAKNLQRFRSGIKKIENLP